MVFVCKLRDEWDSRGDAVTPVAAKLAGRSWRIQAAILQIGLLEQSHHSRPDFVTLECAAKSLERCLISPRVMATRLAKRPCFQGVHDLLRRHYRSIDAFYHQLQLSIGGRAALSFGHRPVRQVETNRNKLIEQCVEAAVYGE